MRSDWLVAIVGGAVGAFFGSVLYTAVTDRWHHHERQRDWRPMIRDHRTDFGYRWKVKVDDGTPTRRNGGGKAR